MQINSIQLNMCNSVEQLALRLVSVVLSTAAIFCCAHSHAQTIDRVDVFRDAAVVTWRTQARPGPCPVARSFHAVMPSDVLVFDEADAPPRGGAQGEEVKWFDTGGEARFEAADKALKSARLELELKRAQLELVEEDLALLRANRKVGGTSESLLVELVSQQNEQIEMLWNEKSYMRD